MPQPGQITPSQLMRLIGTDAAPTIFDVRIAGDIAADPRVIPTSIMQSHDQFLTPPMGVTRAVVVCQRGRKLSEGVAALLRSHGIEAESLEGGTMAWAAAGLPMTAISTLPKTGLWVTRHRPKIDRIACPWLIKRFVDPQARFLFVAPAEVADVAEKFGAIPFDIEGVPFSHEGDFCTFDTMIKTFGLNSAALDRLALVVRAADTDRHDLSSQAAGLLAISVGLSKLYRDDLEQLNAGMAIYDALYRWARDAFDEGHDWPAGRSA